jgi:hypothetical protein
MYVGIMPKVKWRTFSKVNPEQEYLAFANVGEGKHVWNYFNALLRSRKVAQQLKTTKGVIGFTGQLGFFSKKIAVVGVFENEAVLNEFAHSGQHANCMVKFRPVVKEMRPVKWVVLGSKLPPTVEDAINRAKANQ